MSSGLPQRARHVTMSRRHFTTSQEDMTLAASDDMLCLDIDNIAVKTRDVYFYIVRQGKQENEDPKISKLPEVWSASTRFHHFQEMEG